MEQPCIVTSQVFARVGLLGNPSDGYLGKTISVSCANFSAEVCTPITVEVVTTCVLGMCGKRLYIRKALSKAWSLQVHLTPADTITFVPHTAHDLLEYSSLHQFTKQVKQQGYYGGIRVLMV